jgi:REP element-mobilizing transposase RayT
MENNKFQNKYRIPSARAPWWNYSANGCYFITICTAHREHFFGEIITDGDRTFLQLSPIGKIVNQEWTKSFEIRTELYCDAFVIMPNHIHAILRIENILNEPTQTCDAVVETHGRASLHDDCAASLHDDCASLHDDHANLQLKQSKNMPHRSPQSISSFIAGFKSSATKRINVYRNTPGLPVWQTRFHDRIIRDNNEYQRIVDYIDCNPDRWEDDKFYNE